MLVDSFRVDSPNVQYTGDHITSTYAYDTTEVGHDKDGTFVVKPVEQQIQFQTQRKVGKVGCAPIRQLIHVLSAFCCLPRRFDSPLLGQRANVRTLAADARPCALPAVELSASSWMTNEHMHSQPGLRLWCAAVTQPSRRFCTFCVLCWLNRFPHKGLRGATLLCRSLHTPARIWCTSCERCPDGRPGALMQHTVSPRIISCSQAAQLCGFAAAQVAMQVAMSAVTALLLTCLHTCVAHRAIHAACISTAGVVNRTHACRNP